MAMEPITAGIELIGKVIDKIIPDKGAADQAKLKLLELAQSGELQEFNRRADIITAEASSENWLASSWRPITMLTFVALIVARWFGYAAPELADAEYLKLWDIVELGLGGYVVGRSVEKVAPALAGALAKR